MADSLVAAGLLGSSRALSERSGETHRGRGESRLARPTLCVQKSQNKSCSRAWDMYKLPRACARPRFLSTYRESAQRLCDRDSLSTESLYYLVNLYLYEYSTTRARAREGEASQGGRAGRPGCSQSSGRVAAVKGSRLRRPPRATVGLGGNARRPLTASQRPSCWRGDITTRRLREGRVSSGGRPMPHGGPGVRTSRRNGDRCGRCLSRDDGGPLEVP